MPDPPAAPWESTPDVAAAADTEALALAQFEQADVEWRAAYRRLTARDPGTERWAFGAGGVEPPANPDTWLLVGGVLRLWRTGKVRALMDAETDARARRDEAGETLREARAGYSAALRRAEWEHRTQHQATAA
ncbi:MAG TPA: hypothetical protein VHH34_07430 [Pseudonocardiaceae bacterium]|nr:hypothetical protein [Pseudonocardiaceae bacterium]